MNLPVSFGLGQVALDVGFNDRLVDLIEEGWDLAVRVGTLRDSTLAALRLAPCRMVVCAAPAYLAARGAPERVADLPAHNCLGYTLSDRQGPERWCFGADGAVVTPMSGTLRANNGDALRLAALAVPGVIYQPPFLVAEELRTGRLVALTLDQPTTGAGHVHAVFRPDRNLPPKVRAMIDFLAACRSWFRILCRGGFGDTLGQGF